MSDFILFSGENNFESAYHIIQNEFVNSHDYKEIYMWRENNSAIKFTKFKGSPLQGEREFENSIWNIIFIGDLVDYSQVPFEVITECLESKNYNKLKAFNGIFAILAYNKLNKIFSIISDRISQFPIFYKYDPAAKNLIVSSEISFFCKLNKSSDFNEKWLFNLIYFRLQVGDATFINGVKRLPSGSILNFSTQTNEFSVTEYFPVYHKKDKLLEGSEALDYAREVIKKRLSKYFDHSNVACAITAGWDGRTNVALSPDLNKIQTYTYGIEGCNDLLVAKNTASIANLKHLAINFNDEVVNNLPKLMLETVFLSSGLQGILRTTLIHVYKILSEFSLVISGINYDNLFRGHFGMMAANTPLSNVFRYGRSKIKLEPFRDMFEENYSSFYDEIMEKYDEIENRFGNIQSAETHLLYAAYLSTSKYWSGEWKISNLFTTLRVPAIDNEIINLALSIKQSSLTFSELAGHKRGSREEMILQAYIISSLAPLFSKIPIGFTSPKAVLKGDTYFKLYTIYRKLLRRFYITFHSKYLYAKLEDNDYWINELHKNFIDDLVFSKDSLIKEFVSEKYLDKLKVNRDFIMIGNLATTEIILKLMRNKWEKFW